MAFIVIGRCSGGQHFTRVIFDALSNAKYALLLATPDAAESGWLQDEYEYMHKLSNTREDFFWIPLVLGEFPDFPFTFSRLPVPVRTVVRISGGRRNSVGLAMAFV
jgi:hypothetical protein